MMACTLRSALLVCAVTLAGASFGLAATPAVPPPSNAVVTLRAPTPETALEKLMAARRSVRAYTDRDLAIDMLGELAWAAQGVSSPRGFRTAPSAGALFPLELYIAVPAGVYHYDCDAHTLTICVSNDIRAAVGRAAYGQPWVVSAPAQFIFSAVYARETRKYGDRGIRYTDMEAGHAAQNLMLRAVELGLGSVAIGAFNPDALGRLLPLAGGEEVLYVICVGYPRGQ